LIKFVLVLFYLRYYAFIVADGVRLNVEDSPEVAEEEEEPQG